MKLSFRHHLPTFGSSSFFQASIWHGVDKVLQKLTKFYKSELRHKLQWCILIPRKCPRKTPFQHTVGGGVKNCENLPTSSNGWSLCYNMDGGYLIDSLSKVCIQMDKYCASNNKKVERAYSFMKCHTPNWNGRTFNVKFERILRLWELQAGQKSSHIVFTTTIT